MHKIIGEEEGGIFFFQDFYITKVNHVHTFT